MAKNNLIKTVNDKKIAEVLSTKDYKKFQLLKGNRRLNARTYAKILNSMKEEHLMIPILVNENLEIIDGQHRYHASMELGLPVYYVVVAGYGLDEVKRANIASSNWTKEDFLAAFVEEESEHYLVLKELVDVYGVSISVILRMFAKIQNVNQNLIIKYFEDGSFIAEGVHEVEECLKAIDDFSSYKFGKSLQFVSAFVSLYFHDLYDHDRMKERLVKRGHKLVKRSTKDDYLMILTKDIYSFGAVRKPIFYDKDSQKFYTN